VSVSDDCRKALRMLILPSNEFASLSDWPSTADAISSHSFRFSLDNFISSSSSSAEGSSSSPKRVRNRHQEHKLAARHMKRFSKWREYTILHFKKFFDLLHPRPF
jgi:hypothetical protein